MEEITDKIIRKNAAAEHKKTLEQEDKLIKQKYSLYGCDEPVAL